MHGREWALNVLSDGTLLMPNAILSADVFASAGESGAGVWRSTDSGKSWARTPVAYGNDTADAAPEWSVLEVPAKQLPQVATDAGMVTMLGVSVSLEGKSKVGGPGSDPGQVVTWLSTDVSVSAPLSAYPWLILGDVLRSRAARGTKPGT